MSRLPRKPLKIKADAKGAGQQARRARNVVQLIDREFGESARNVGTDAELIYQAHAPIRSGRLKSGIRATPVGEDQVIVTARAVDPDSGFDYVAVTRFGHRKRVIIPVTRRGQARKSRAIRRGPGGRFIARGGGMLAFESLGRHWILPAVRGFRPKTDWVETAWSEVRAAADTELEQTGNKIEVRWSS
jgi:hypothetical protein